MVEMIAEKQQKLKEIGGILKSRYRGIDEVIDKIMKSIEMWYIFDDVLYKPTIISLWSLTGCGKTNLIRDLAKLLNMFDKFCEVDVSRTQEEVDGRRSSYRYNGSVANGNSVATKLFNVVNDTNEKAILLIDEIQKIKKSGSKFDDVWNLLSDGRLGNGISILSRYEDRIQLAELWFDDYDQYLRETEYTKNLPQVAQGPGGFFNPNETPSQPRWNPYTQPIPSSRSYYVTMSKSLLKAETFEDFAPVFDIHQFGQGYEHTLGFGCKEYYRNRVETGKMELNDIFDVPGLFYARSLLNMTKRAYKRILDRFNDANGRDPLVFSKLLIFTAGNIDGLYKDHSDINIDADELYEKTSKLTVDDLKNEMLKIFAAEEVARFGGNLIAYPSLNKEAFVGIIKDTLKLVEADTLKTTNINVDLSQEVYINELYDKCVVATQGARPLISKIQTEVSTILPKLIKEAYTRNVDSISILDV